MSRIWMRVLSCITVLALMLTTAPLAVSAQDVLSEYGFTYTVNDRGHVTILSCTLQDPSVEIPMYLGYDNLIVTDIAANAFDGCTALKTLTMPFSIHSIGEDAFGDCAALQTVQYTGDERGWAKMQIAAGNEPLLSSSREYLAVNLVYGDNNSRYAIYSDFTAALVEYNGYEPNFTAVPETVFYDYTVTTIAATAFSQAYSLYGIAIPDTVTVIEDNAFANCHYLDRVIYEGSYEQWCRVSVGNGNDVLATADLYFEGTSFEDYDGGTYALLPDGTAHLLSYYGYYSEELRIPDEVYGHVVTRIRHDVFSYTYDVTRVYLPGTLTYIGANNFTSCYNLQTIYFSGDESDWQSIQIEAGNEPLAYADIFYDGTTFHYSDIFYYAVLPDNTVMILECHPNDPIVTIPNTINGHPVTAIAGGAFFQDTVMNVLNIEADLTLIKKYAFNGVTGLNTILYHGSEAEWNAIRVEEGNDQFVYCLRYCNVSDLVVENALRYLLFADGTATLLGGTPQEYASTLTVPEYVQGHRVTAIAPYAFAYSGMFNGIVMPRSVTTVGDGAFAGGYIDWVCYAGTQDEWFSMSIGYDNDALLFSYTYYESVSILQSDGITYRISTDGEAEVLGGCDNNRLVIPDTVEGYPVTAIAPAAYREYSGLTEVIIGNNVELISWNAFEHCSSLTRVVLGDSVYDIQSYAFYGCTSLSDVNFSDHLYFIGDYAFYTTAFTELTIPACTYVSDYAFGSCCNLMRITLESVYSLSYNAFADSYPRKILCMENDAAWNSYASQSSLGMAPCVTNVAKVMEQDGLCYVLRHDGTVAFADAPYYIENVEIAPTVEGYDVTVIPYGAFYQSFSLVTLTIPDTVTTIDHWAFYYCSRLTSVNLPDSLTFLGDFAFAYCEELREITIPGSVETIGYDAFFCCSLLTSVTVGEGVTAIGYDAFSDCRSLTTLTLPSTLTFVESSAFFSCDALTDVYYNGTQNEWSAITIEDRNEPLLAATLHTKALPGDLDGNNIITTDDTRLILTTILAGDAAPTEDELAAADFNKDGIVNTSDIRAILLAIVLSPDA